MNRLAAALLCALALLPLTGCPGGGGGGGGGSSSAPAPTSSTWAADLTHDDMGGGFSALGETDTTVTIGADGVLDFQTVHLGRITKASGSEWYGGPGGAWLLRLTYDATAKTVEVRRVTMGSLVRWSLTAVPTGSG